MNFCKIQRSSCIGDGCRLATYEEARNDLETIKEKGLLKEWERARLLDGWISGSGYNYQMGNDFRGCMAFMLVIKLDLPANIASGSLYKDITLSKNQKEVALLLCTEDWNYEVVYWVLNSLSGSETMDLADVAHGNMPCIDPVKFKDMNNMMHDVAETLVNEGPASEKAAKRKFSDPNFVQEVLTGMIEYVKKQQAKMESFSLNDTWGFQSFRDNLLEELSEMSLESTWLGDIVSEGGLTWEAIANAFWNFLSESFASFMLLYFACAVIVEICRFTNQWDRKKFTRVQENFFFASHVLFYISLARCEIIHEPLTVYSKGFCPSKILCWSSEKAELQPERLNNMLQENALWKCYEETGNYDVLDKILILASKGQALLQKGKKVEILVIERLLKCGAKPGRSLLSCKGKTALHYAAKLEDENVAKCLLENCDRDQQENFLNKEDDKRRTALHRSAELGCMPVCKLLLDYGARLDVHDECGQTVLHKAVEPGKAEVIRLFIEKTNTLQRASFVNAKDDEGRTALHRSTELGCMPVCKLLLDYGAQLDVQDIYGQTVLHYAVELGNEEVIDLFIENSTVHFGLQVRNKNRKTPLDKAIAQKNINLVAPLLSMSDRPEAYFSEVDLRQLLRQSLLKGYVKIVKLLLDKGEELPDDDINDHGKTSLHLATMSENKEKAEEMVDLILEKSDDKEKAVAMRDRRGRTVLHEAGFKGHTLLCKKLLDMNPDLIKVKDKDGRNALYDAVQCKHDHEATCRVMYEAYRKRGGKLDDVVDRRGLTPLHVAAEEGRRYILEYLLSITQAPRKYMKKADFLGQTALHKASKLGDKETLDVLLREGNPFQERDCDGRTALHYVVESKIGNEKKELIGLLLNSCKSPEERLLFLWASAAGVGPADQNLGDPEIKNFLSNTKTLLLNQMKFKNLLQIAAYIGHTGMAKELLSRGFQIADIQDRNFLGQLSDKEKENVKKVSTELDRIAEQGNDMPTIEDNLERRDYARGLAALLLNPFLKPPIAVGISGDWGKGKSSLMIQTERILLETVAQLAILPSSQLSRSTSDLPGVQVLQLSEEGKKRAHEIKRQLDMRVELQGEDADSLDGFLNTFLSNYETKYRDIFKSLAVMDSTKMFTAISQEQSVPAIITIQYNAWKYKTETEALAGMAVEITREIEASMTDPQWLTTCFRNTWRKQKYSIWIEIIFPCLLAMVLACSFTWIVWLVFDRYKMEKWAKTKYACVPAVIIVAVWILSKSVMGVFKPVSTQLMNYISFPDHADKLGYQERVISDITFLKVEIGRKPSKICTAIMKLWHLVIILKLWLTAMCSSPECLGNAGTNMKFPPAHSKDLRIIVFVDDLDRCQESVILQVLAAINLVLAVCEINVVLGMDKRMLERAIIKKYGDSKTKSSKANKELADNYLQKIIQLPLDLPDPSKEQLTGFLKRHMSVVQKESDDNDFELDKNAHNAKIKRGHMRKLLSLQASSDVINGTITHGTEGENQPRSPALPTPSISIVVDSPPGERQLSVTSREGTKKFGRAKAAPPKPREPNTLDGHNTDKARNKRSNPLIPIPIREMLFVTYSSGEWDAIHYFQELATNCRKHPREWKRFLNYHRLVWNIFSINVVEKPLVGWQVQLISWIFICWEWKENMDILIQDWCSGDVLKTLSSQGPSLGLIVEHFIEERGSNSSEAEGHENRKGKHEEKGLVTNREQSNKDKKMAETANQENTARTAEEPEEKENRLKKAEVEIKEEMRAMKEQLLSMEKSLEEVKKTIKELKLGQGTKKGTPDNENSMDGKKIKQKDMSNWWRLRLALDKYDVSMDGIQAFQRFRFHCVPGHLQWPLPKQEWEAYNRGK